MKAILAGYNIDIDVIKQAQQLGIPSEQLTPEVLSAAYARISRDPRPVGELRRDALEEVAKARRSNRTIIFGMGHHSVAEHAVFNFDITEISRLAIETLEKFRLCSFTEKSQRYITLDNDFIIPEEFRGTLFEGALLRLISSQADCYEKFYQRLRIQLIDKHPEMSQKRAGQRLLDSWAKEDARYVTVLATTGQLGLTVNARNLELMVRRFRSSELSELQELGTQLYKAGADVAPSVLLFTDAASIDTETPGAIRDLGSRYFDYTTPPADNTAVRLVEYTPNPDRMLAAALLHTSSSVSLTRCRQTVDRLSDDELREIFFTTFRYMEFFDAPPREFEHVWLSFELVVSASCYAQLKRHRMSTQTVQDYDLSLGWTVPPSIVDAGLETEFHRHLERSEALYQKVLAEIPAAAPYVLTNAHRRRVVMTLNLREMYHFVRLREDKHAQWDIRCLAEEIRRQTETVMPLGSLLLCGKDQFVQQYERVFGTRPKVDPDAL